MTYWSPINIGLDCVSIIEVTPLKKISNLATNDAEVTVSHHTAIFTTNVFSEGGNCMFQGGSNDVS